MSEFLRDVRREAARLLVRRALWFAVTAAGVLLMEHGTTATAILSTR